MTSHDVIYYIRKVLKEKKVGHTGTLDPEAAGVLPVCIGKATKAVQYITEKRKQYIAIIKFGIITDTFDIYGNILKQNSLEEIDIQRLNDILPMFIGKIKQRPPIYSAIKVKGKKLYEYALKNEEIEIAEREVEIYDIKIKDIVKHDEIMIECNCSKGTYIRSLCHDIGMKMGTGACMGQLIRTKSEPFSIFNSVTLEEIKLLAEKNQIDSILLPIEHTFVDFFRIDVKESARKAAMNGNNVYEQGLINPVVLGEIPIETFVKLFISDEFIGIGSIQFEKKEERKYIKIINIFI